MANSKLWTSYYKIKDELKFIQAVCEFCDKDFTDQFEHIDTSIATIVGMIKELEKE